ncbi:phosphotransferase [Streptomyces buecherae]|uniref:Phosphotransferase n=1 Tax=Streptomyces buecherae TaxID=2763006 RepID=A0A7H8NAL1_9ACTN|nr:phosphotransferase [Streptomyces buecherae]QKW51505.1 phosphotransferase [Streptomyces buecherae]
MYSPPTDSADRQRMTEAFNRAMDELGATVDGPEVWGWFGRTLSARVRCQKFGRCWLRLVSAPEDKATGKTWEGNALAAEHFDATVTKPALYASAEDTRSGYSYRAELSQYVSEDVCSASPVLSPGAAVPPGAWWASLRADLDTVAKASTDRVAVRQEWADRSVPRFLNRPAPQITEWETAHGDMHPANLTAGTPYLLDWEGFGTAPVGYDPAMLLAYSLLAPHFAERVRETFPVLDTEAGRVAQIIVITELMQSASRGDHPELVPALRALAEGLA